MSVAQRTIARLPLELFAAVRDAAPTVDHDHDDDGSVGCEDSLRSAEVLRQAICAKLKTVSRRNNRGGTTSDGVSTVGELLQLSPGVLLRTLDPLLTYSSHQLPALVTHSLLRPCRSSPGECERLLEQASILCAPPPRTARSLLPSAGRDASDAGVTHIPTGLPGLDEHLQGGLRIGGVTELVGPASVGKSQLAMQVAVHAAIRRQGSILMDTEQKLSLLRLREIAVAQCATEGAGGRDAQQILSNMTVHSIGSTDSLTAALSHLEEEILVRSEDEALFPVRLIVLDSIAAPVRRDMTSAPHRAAVVMQYAQTLKRLADDYRLAIVVINQVGSARVPSEAPSGPMDAAFESVHEAALGTSWHHCVTTRLRLEPLPLPAMGAPSSVRRCSIVKSNVVAPADFLFRVTERGVVEVSTSHVRDDDDGWK